MDRRSRMIVVICLIIIVIALGVIISYTYIKDKMEKESAVVEEYYCNLKI